MSWKIQYSSGTLDGVDIHNSESEELVKIENTIPEFDLEIQKNYSTNYKTVNLNTLDIKKVEALHNELFPLRYSSRFYERISRIDDYAFGVLLSQEKPSETDSVNSWFYNLFILPLISKIYGDSPFYSDKLRPDTTSITKTIYNRYKNNNYGKLIGIAIADDSPEIIDDAESIILYILAEQKKLSNEHINILKIMLNQAFWPETASVLAKIFYANYFPKEKLIESEIALISFSLRNGYQFFINSLADGYLYLLSLGVSENFRKKGIAQYMMNRIIDLAKKTGKHAVFLHSVDYNDAANNFYLKNNFKNFQIIKGHYRIKDKNHDANHFGLMIEPTTVNKLFLQKIDLIYDFSKLILDELESNFPDWKTTDSAKLFEAIKFAIIKISNKKLIEFKESN